MVLKALSFFLALMNQLMSVSHGHVSETPDDGDDRTERPSAVGAFNTCVVLKNVITERNVMSLMKIISYSTLQEDLRCVIMDQYDSPPPTDITCNHTRLEQITVDLPSMIALFDVHVMHAKGNMLGNDHHLK